MESISDMPTRSRHFKKNQTSIRRQSGGEPGAFPPGLRAVVGVHACEEVLKVRSSSIKLAWIKQGDLEGAVRPTVEKLRAAQIPIQPKPNSILEKVSHSHQGLCLWVNEAPQLDWSRLESGRHHKQILILDGLEDPRNLGAILRTSWLLEAQAVFVPSSRSVSLTATAAKAACGGAEHVPLEIYTSFPALKEELAAKSFWLYGLCEAGTDSLWGLPMNRNVAWVLGAEGRGLRAATEKFCDLLVRIPQVASGSSYNVSIAAALAMAEFARSKSEISL